MSDIHDENPEENTAESDPEGTPDRIPEGEPDSAAGPDPEGTPDRIPEDGPDSAADPAPEDGPDSAADPAPEGGPEGIPDPASGSRKRRKKGWTALLAVCIIVVIAAAASIIAYQVNLHRKAAAYEELQETYTDAEEEETAQEDETASVNIPIDFDALQEENADIYAWIRIKDTVIDYPILQSEDDEYYLNHTVDGDEGYPGSIYTQSRYNGTDMTDNVTVIYGHNMRDGSMFGDLSSYSDEEYRKAHQKIKIYTPEHIFTYKVVFAVTYDDRHILNTFNTEKSKGYTAFLSSIQSEHYIPSWTADPFEVTTADRLIVLSTCNNNDSRRYLVGAVLVKEQ